MKTRKLGFGLGIGIFLFPYVFSWFALDASYTKTINSSEGYSKRVKVAAFIWLAFVWLISTIENGSSGFWTSLVLTVIGAFIFFGMTHKKSLATMRENPELFFELAKERGYTSVSEQKGFAKRVGLDWNDISGVKTEHSLSPKYPKEESNGLERFHSEEKITLWSGSTKPIEFTYSPYRKPKERRSVRPTEVFFTRDGKFYISGYCELRKAPRTFNQHNFETKIKVGSRRYDFDEWCDEVLGIDIFSACPESDIKIT